MKKKFLFSSLLRKCIKLLKYLFLVQEVVILCENFFLFFIYFSSLFRKCIQIFKCLFLVQEVVVLCEKIFDFFFFCFQDLFTNLRMLIFGLIP